MGQYMSDNNGNLVDPILKYCRQTPERTAIVVPALSEADTETRLSYRDLEKDIAAFQTGLKTKTSLQAGDRVVILFRPDRRFYPFLLALMGVGMVPVFIDTGMGLRKILQALEDSQAKAVITTGKLLKFRWLSAALRRAQCFRADGEGGVAGLSSLMIYGDEPAVAVPRDVHDHGLMTFTSGSTGRPKAADRTHRLLNAQHAALHEAWPLQDNDIPITSLPVFLLYGLGSGVTTILADCDLGKPAQVDPARMVQQFEREKATIVIGAPAFTLRIADHLATLEDYPETLPIAFVGGAPSSPAMVTRYAAGFGADRVFIGYGSTEAEPMSLIRADEILAADEKGVLVGKPVDSAEILITSPLAAGGSVLEADIHASALPDNTIGEIVVKGPHVLKQYVDNPKATRESKIPCSDGQVWHRTGDRGFFDEQGRLWLMGRDKDILRAGDESFEPFTLEFELEKHPDVQRAAIVSPLGLDEAHAFLELTNDADPKSAIRDAWSRLPWHADGGNSVSVVSEIPVDGRHNSKIDRPKLRNDIVKKMVGPRPYARWIVSLNSVDLLSLFGALFAVLAGGLVLNGHFAFALAALSVAMLCDGLDGFLARRLGTIRPFGRYLDGFIDVLDYLVVPALFLYVWGFTGPLDLVAISVFLAAGVIRLAVFNEVGNVPRISHQSGYLGMPVFWSIFILWVAYLAIQMIEREIVFWVLDAILILYGAAMLHNAAYFKFTKLAHLLMFPIIGALTFSVLGLFESLPDQAMGILQKIGAAFLLTLPVVIGMSLHMLVVSKDWLRWLKVPVHTGLFGANKTIRGFIIGPLLCILGAWPTLYLATYFPELETLGVTPTDAVILGIVMGLGYMLFELPNSFVKRRFGIIPGGEASRGRLYFIVFDQIDSSLGIALFAYLFFAIHWSTALLTCILFPFVAFGVKQVLFALRWKKTNV